MNVSVYIFGNISSGRFKYPDEISTYEIFDRFTLNSYDSSQLLIHREKHLVYYAFIQKLKYNRYIGLCAVLNDVMLTDFEKLFCIFEYAVERMALQNILIKKTKKGNYISCRGTNLDYESIDVIREQLRKEISEKMADNFVPLPSVNYSTHNNCEKRFQFNYSNDNEGITEASYNNGYTYLYRNISLKKVRRKQRVKSVLKFGKRVLVCALFAMLIYLGYICFLNYRHPSIPALPSQLTIEKYGGKIALPLKMENGYWHIANPSGEWYVTEYRNDTLYVSAATNHGEERKENIIFEFPSTLFGREITRAKREVTLVQPSGEATYINLSGYYYSFDKYGKSETDSIIRIDTDGVPLGYEYNDDLISMSKKNKDDRHPSWINIKTYRDRYILSAISNNTDARTGEIDIYIGSLKKTVNVAQESGLATTLEVEPKGKIDVSELGDNLTFYITTDGLEWTIESPSFINIEKYNDYMVVDIPPSDEELNFEIKVCSNNNHEETIKFYQHKERAKKSNHRKKR